MSARIVLRAIFFGGPLLVIGLIYTAPAIAALLYQIIAFTVPLWLPVLGLILLWPLWRVCSQSWYASSIPYVTLELKPGENTPKTARPMELVFYSLYFRTPISRLDILLQGTVRVPWAFEVMASGGIVRFFIHVPLKDRIAIEGRLKAEYRDIDIDEVSDYSRERDFNPFTSRLAMREYTLQKADPYPLRTYQHHERAKVRRDVFGELLEELAHIGEGEELWVSLMIRPHQREWSGSFWSFLEAPLDALHTDAQREIENIVGYTGDIRRLTPAQQEVIAAIEAGLQKPSFDCGLRALYLARRDAWNEERADSLEHLFDRFSDPALNSLGAYNPRVEVGWPLSDVFAALPAFDMEYFLKLYRRRAFFSPPYLGKRFVLNTEELATLFHLPKVGRASALARSRGGSSLEPPENLPL